MANGAGGDLHDRRAGLAQPLRVVVRRKVTNNHACLQVRSQLAHALANKGGLARAGGGKEVQHQEAARAEEAAVALSEAVVLIENSAAHFDGSACFAAGVVGVFMVRFIMRMGVGVSMRVGMVVVMEIGRASG